MNQRIRQLYIQAINDTKHDPADDINIQIAEKFAQLIVQECINQCAHAPDVSEDWYQGVKWVANEIAQHFGVEL